MALVPRVTDPVVIRQNNVRQGLHAIGDLYSDYTITCKDYSAPVHQIVLHVQSTVFARAFSGKPREAQLATNVMDLPEDDFPT